MSEITKEDGFVNYQEALAYIYSFTDYERGSQYVRRSEENLELEASFLQLLGDPQERYTSTLIAGTKGKGSTSAYIEHVLREAGIRTGLYTQPDLHTFRERMRVNGRLISEQEVADLIPDVSAAVEALRLRGDSDSIITYHISTVLAFLYFARQHVQHAVLEVGLGGRLDATNVTHPLVSVISSISYDHMSVLGNTLTQIATEKAGIIKQDGVVVTAAQSPEALLAIAAVAQQRHAHLLRIGSAAGDPAQEQVEAGQLPPLSYRYSPVSQTEKGQCFNVWAPEGSYMQLETPLLGEHQLENATLALATLDQLRVRNLSWDEKALRTGFANVRWPARLEVVAHDPTIIVDGAHNADSLHKLIAALGSLYPASRPIIVLGMNRDKDLPRSIKELAGVDSIVLTRSNNPRAASPDDLALLCAEYAPGVPCYRSESCDQAMDYALHFAEPTDIICATGSLYLAGEALRWAASHGSITAAAGIEGVDR